MASDLGAVAQANAGSVRARADAVQAADPTGKLADFRALASRTQMSSNVSADKVLAFHATGFLLDKRSLLAHSADPAQIAAFATSSWTARREAFEDLWVDGRTAFYGALNAGGMGTEGSYGPICLLLGEPTAHGGGVAVFPADSAQRYTTPAAAIDAPLAAAEVAPWEERGSQAVIQRGSEALGALPASWPLVVCRPEHYLEVVRVGAQAPLAVVSEVRLRRAEMDRLDDLDQTRLRGGPLSPTDRASLAAYDAIQDWRRRLGVVVSAV